MFEVWKVEPVREGTTIATTALIYQPVSPRILKRTGEVLCIQSSTCTRRGESERMDLGGKPAPRPRRGSVDCTPLARSSRQAPHPMVQQHHTEPEQPDRSVNVSHRCPQSSITHVHQLRIRNFLKLFGLTFQWNIYFHRHANTIAANTRRRQQQQQHSLNFRHRQRQPATSV